MAKQIGSQYRQTLLEAGYRVDSLNADGSAILINEDGKYERWQENDHHAGWTLEIEGIGYEFCSSLS